MLQQVGQTLGAERGLERATTTDVARDQRQLAFNRRAESAGAAVDQRIEAPHCPIETLDRLCERPLSAGAEVVERDDLCHAPNDSPRV